ncbi:MAG: choice-of-anchor tandem repeat GloVer-containing protein [Limisphaerales bacterium]
MTVYSFNRTDGEARLANLIPSDSTHYETTSSGGATGSGTVFAVNTDGTSFTVLHRFNGVDGADSQSSLLLSGNTLYGTTVSGGSNDAGTIFAITLPSIPAIDASSMAVSGGQFQFVVNGLTPGATVYVQASSDLSSTGNWFPVATNVVTATNLTISGLSVTNGNSRFFRVLETSGGN